MTTHELAKLLLEQPNVPAYSYTDEAEEYGSISGVDLYTEQDKLPYAKSDQPKMESTGIVLISGWCI